MDPNQQSISPFPQNQKNGWVSSHLFPCLFLPVSLLFTLSSISSLSFESLPSFLPTTFFFLSCLSSPLSTLLVLQNHSPFLFPPHLACSNPLFTHPPSLLALFLCPLPLKTPLHEACEYGRMDVARLLLIRGADLKKKSVSQWKRGVGRMRRQEGKERKGEGRGGVGFFWSLFFPVEGQEKV